jgi:hypothetical protein
VHPVLGVLEGGVRRTFEDVLGDLHTAGGHGVLDTPSSVVRGAHAPRPRDSC